MASVARQAMLIAADAVHVASSSGETRRRAPTATTANCANAAGRRGSARYDRRVQPSAAAGVVDVALMVRPNSHQLTVAASAKNHQLTLLPSSRSSTRRPRTAAPIEVA